MSTVTDSPPPVIDPIDDASELLPDAAVGKILKVSPTTIWRWRTKGRLGVRLPAIPHRRGYATTRAAVRWFYSEIQRRQQNADYSPTPRRRPGTKAERDALDAECAAAGI